jgi:FkbM family methyltransferase
VPSLRKRLSMLPGLRPVALRLLQVVGGRDVFLRHPVTRDRLFLNLYLHRGYWFQRTKLEDSETTLISEVLSGAEGLIVDVGANIGFLSLIYRAIAPEAQVIAIEPSPKNLSYLYINVEPHGIQVLPFAVGSNSGTAVLFEDSLTGQNSSLVQDFKVLAANAKRAGIRPEVVKVSVEMMTLDGLLESAHRPVIFIKIDVEGFELQALEGASYLLASERPIIQVEVQRDVAATLSLLRDAGYQIFVAKSESQLFSEERPSVVFAVHATSRQRDPFVLAAKRHGFSAIS